MNSIQHINHLEIVSQHYDLYAIDLWGVMYDGLNVFEKAANCVEALLKLKKQVVFISNSPRPNRILHDKLDSLHFVFEDLRIITSGDFFLNQTYNSSNMKNFFDSTIFIVGASISHDLIAAGTFRVVTELDKADYIIVLGSNAYNKGEANKFDNILERAIDMKIPCLCPNPDIIAPYSDTIIYTPGAYAKRYKEMGGAVYYYGKPYQEFYNFALNQYETPKEKVLAIGDTVETDLLGAKNFGIDSLFIKSSTSTVIDSEKIMKIHGVVPKYQMSYLQF